jgi:thioredoxin 1
MNKYLLIGLAVVVLIGVVIFITDSQQDTKSEVLENVRLDQAEQSIQNESSIASKNPNLDNNSKYVEYSKEALDRSSTSRRVLYFYASWCPTCRPADADFRTNLNKFPEDLVLIRVNYNDPDTDQEEKDLAKKYAVTYQHTFVQIDAAGKEITKWNGGQTEELLENIK